MTGIGLFLLKVNSHEDNNLNSVPSFIFQCAIKYTNPYFLRNSIRKANGHPIRGVVFVIDATYF